MSDDKIDDFIKQAAALTHNEVRAQQKYNESRGRRKSEVELWHHWNDNGRQPEHLEPLMKSMEPMIRSEAKKRLPGLGGTMPAPALRQELRNSAAKAVETYNPDRGAQLSTHVYNNFMRVTDVVSLMRNPKYNPRDLSDRYGAYDNAVKEFHNENGRSPTVPELQEKLQWSPKTIRRMQKGFGEERFTDMGDAVDHEQHRDQAQTVRHAAMLMRSTMTPQQQQFVDLHYPAPGQSQMSVAAIARHLKLPEHRVYRIKKTVESKLSPLVKSQ